MTYLISQATGVRFETRRADEVNEGDWIKSDLSVVKVESSEAMSKVPGWWVLGFNGVVIPRLNDAPVSVVCNAPNVKVLNETQD